MDFCLDALSPNQRSNMRELVLLWLFFVQGLGLDMKFYNGDGATGVCVSYSARAQDGPQDMVRN